MCIWRKGAQIARLTLTEGLCVKHMDIKKEISLKSVFKKNVNLQGEKNSIAVFCSLSWSLCGKYSENDTSNLFPFFK